MDRNDLEDLSGYAHSLTQVLALPPPPSQTHREERGQLSPFPPGEPSTRRDRAREYLEVAGRKIAELHRAAASGLSICRLIAEMTDRLLIGVWGELVAELDSPRPIALLALGGYGRRELAPHSDLDLLMLPSHRVPQRELEPLSRIFSTFLWDLQRVPGWSVRNPAESVKAAEDDHTIRTALLDCRFLAGDQRVFQTLSDQLLRELLSHRGSQFIADKAEEVRLRREKYGDSVFVLEPDIKQSEGGLRDLQAALWIAQARFRVRGLGGLLKQSILSGSQVQLLRAARDFLLRIRNELHYTQGRKEDRLTFELQEHVAHFLGYADGPQGLFVAFVSEGSISLLVVLWYTALQRLVPDRFLGRVMSLDWMISIAGLPLSFAVVGPLASWIGTDETLILAGVLGAAVTIAAMFIPGARSPERDGRLAGATVTRS